MDDHFARIGARCSLALVALAAACSAGAVDKLIATVPFARSLGVHATLTEGHMQLCAGLPEGCNPTARLDFPAMTTASQGSTVWTDATTAHFGGYTGFFTNGVKDPAMAMFMLGGGSGWAGFDTQFLASQVGPNGIDLGGFAIHRIGYRIDALSIVSPGSDAAHDGVWTDASVSGAFLFEGTCASRPVIATLRPVSIPVCGKVATVRLSVPRAHSACTKAPTVTGVVFEPSDAHHPIPVINGRVSLPAGVHTVHWSVNDGYHSTTSQQRVTLVRQKRCPH